MAYTRFGLAAGRELLAAHSDDMTPVFSYQKSEKPMAKV